MSEVTTFRRTTVICGMRKWGSPPYERTKSSRTSLLYEGILFLESRTSLLYAGILFLNQLGMSFLLRWIDYSMICIILDERAHSRARIVGGLHRGCATAIPRQYFDRQKGWERCIEGGEIGGQVRTFLYFPMRSRIVWKYLHSCSLGKFKISRIVWKYVHSCSLGKF